MGWHGPIISIYKNRFQRNSNCDCELVQVMDEESLKKKINDGIDIYFTDSAESQINILYNYSLSKYISTDYLLSNIILLK